MRFTDLKILQNFSMFVIKKSIIHPKTILKKIQKKKSIFLFEIIKLLMTMPLEERAHLTLKYQSMTFYVFPSDVSIYWVM